MRYLTTSLTLALFVASFTACNEGGETISSKPVAETAGTEAATTPEKDSPKKFDPAANQAEAPAGVTVPEGMNYNEYFAGNMIAMAAPLSEEAVEYADGTKATVEQMSEDVSVFLSWAAEPELEERKRMGIKVILFLLVLTGLLYVVKRRIWADVH